MLKRDGSIVMANVKLSRKKSMEDLMRETAENILSINRDLLSAEFKVADRISSNEYMLEYHVTQK